MGEIMSCHAMIAWRAALTQEKESPKLRFKNIDMTVLGMPHCCSIDYNRAKISPMAFYVSVYILNLIITSQCLISCVIES